MSEGRSSAGRTISELVAGMNAGQHLALDAVVAFVDGELDGGAHDRAAEHLAGCGSCAAEVTAQRQTRTAVQSASGPVMPSSLLDVLRSIPETAVLPSASGTMAVGSDGTILTATPTCALGTVTSAPSRPRSRHGRQAAGSVVSGVVLGALMLAAAGGAPSQEEPATETGVRVPLAGSAGSVGQPVGTSGTWQPAAQVAVPVPVPVRVVPGGWAVGLR